MADDNLPNRIIASPAARIFDVDRSFDVRCGPCSGMQYRGVVTPEAFCTAYFAVGAAAGTVTLAAVSYTIFQQGQGLNSSDSTNTAMGALTGVPTSRDTSMWGDALGIDGDRYQVVGLRVSVGTPFTQTGTDLAAARVGVQMGPEDLGRLRALVAQNVGLYIFRGSNDCEHPLGIVDAFRIGPEDDDKAGNRNAQPVYLSDPMNFIAKEGGRAENCNVKLQVPGAGASQVLDAYADTATLYVPVRVWLTIVRPAGDMMCAPKG